MSDIPKLTNFTVTETLEKENNMEYSNVEPPQIFIKDDENYLDHVKSMSISEQVF